MEKKIFVAIFLVVSPVFWGVANAVQYSFYNITNNNATDAAIGESQLLLDVIDVGNGKVEFKFTNIGPWSSSITDIYFDDDAHLMNYLSFDYITGDVAYTVGANPGNLPGGNDPAYHFSSNYDYDSDNPVQSKGVNPGEQLGIIFNLLDVSFQGVISALDGASMRVGIHAQGFQSGGSESFINDTGNPVPEPATMLLFGTGIAGLAGIVRRKRD